jgi:hypothetical protein
VACSTYAASAAVTAATSGRGAAGTAAAWLATWTWAAAFPPLAALLPLLFPDGRPPSSRWRPAVGAAAGLVVALCTVAALSPGPVDERLPVDNPLGVAALASTREAVQGVLALGLLVLSLVGLAGLVVRWRRAGPVERRQVAWFGYGLAVVVVASFLTSGWLLHLLSLALPAAVAVAVVRYRLYDIDRLVDRTAVGAALLAGAALLYAAVVGWAGAVLGERGALPGFVGAAAVALAFAPARLRVQRAVDRMLHGRRGDPYALLTDLAASLQSAAHPSRGPCATRCTASPRDCACPRGRHGGPGPTAARRPSGAGEASLPSVLRTDLRWHGEVLGTLEAAPRPGTDDLDPLENRRLLADLAGQVAAVAYALRLSQDLEHGRNALVTAVAEERPAAAPRPARRGSAPSSPAWRSGSAAPSGPWHVVTTRGRATCSPRRGASSRGGVADVRRLARHCARRPRRPRAARRPAHHRARPRRRPAVDVPARDLPPCPPRSRCGYRIVQEALTNVTGTRGGASAACARDADVLEL